jgi:hypothetical protein
MLERVIEWVPQLLEGRRSTITGHRLPEFIADRILHGRSARRRVLSLSTRTAEPHEPGGSGAAGAA